MLKVLTPRHASLTIGIIAIAIIIGAWIFEYAGYAPCEMCLTQRWAYYLGIPFAMLIAVWNPAWIRAALWLMALWVAGQCRVRHLSLRRGMGLVAGTHHLLRR
jgi:disulfide bond formation protein DsbB